MSLVFDTFSSLKHAEKVADIIARRFGRKTHIYPHQDAVRAAFDAFMESYRNEKPDPDPDLLITGYPFGLRGPVLLVERTDDYSDEEYERERAIESAVKELGGTFAGT